MWVDTHGDGTFGTLELILQEWGEVRIFWLGRCVGHIYLK